MNNNRVHIIGVPISAVNMDIAISNIFENLDAVKGQYICASNVHTTVMAHDDPEYYQVQAESFMSVPDGKPLSFLGRKEFPEMERVTGTALMKQIFLESKTRDLKHYFYGSKQETLDNLSLALRQDYPWLNIAGMEPSVFRDMSEEEEQELADRINATNPDFVWVALGAPRQEKFCFRMKNNIKAVMVGVGGAFNVLSGIVPEAPQWMQKRGLEWVYRFLKEPKRLFKRYFTTNPKFVWYLVTGKKIKQ